MIIWNILLTILRVLYQIVSEKFFIKNELDYKVNSFYFYISRKKLNKLRKIKDPIDLAQVVISSAGKSQNYLFN
jgi:hypothetical protein